MLPTEKPSTLFSKVESVQIVLASIAGSMFAVVWVTSFDVVINIFKPDYLKALSIFRMSLAMIGLFITALTGLKGIIKLAKFFIELLELYNRLKKTKNETKDQADE